jgi:hypothetical protein
MAESSGMIREIDASLKEGLKKGHERASKTLQNKKWDAVTACCFERVRLFSNTGNFLIRNSHGGGKFRWVACSGDIREVSIRHGGKKSRLQGFCLFNCGCSSSRWCHNIGN